MFYAYDRKLLTLHSSAAELSDISIDAQTKTLHNSSEMGKSLPSNGVNQRVSDDQPLSASSKTDHRLSWFQHTQPKLVPYLPTRLASSTPYEEDHRGRWTYWYPPLHADNQIRRRWSELRRVWSPPPFGGSHVLGELHRPKPLRYRPYAGTQTTNWQRLSTGCFQ